MIDILMAAHNSERFIEEQLSSLFAQTIKDFELIISDDASIDDTPEILEKWRQNHDNIRVIRHDTPLGSAKANFLFLLAQSKGDYAMFCDHDDVWDENKVELTLNAMQNAENEHGNIPLLVHSDLCVVNSALETINPSLFAMQELDSSRCALNNLLVQNLVTGCTAMINKPLLEAVRYRDASRIIMHDHYLALIAAAFGSIVFINKSTIKYRQHGVNEVGAKDVSSGEYISSRLKDTNGIKKALSDTYAQAAEFYDSYKEELSEKDALMVKTYAAFPNMTKKQRHKALKEFDLYKNTFKRRLGQLIWG